MITVRKPESIYQAQGEIENGTFQGRWHFSFDQYYDPAYSGFGTLRVLNDDTLSPGAVWPLHPHREIEVVTYCVGGEFRHADERGAGGVLKKGWVQHTSVGRGMWHSEINNLPDEPMRFIQMWFMPSSPGLEPLVEQRPVERAERMNRFLALVSSAHPGAVPIHSDAHVLACFLQEGHRARCAVTEGHGVYLYVWEGGPVEVNRHLVPGLGAATIENEPELRAHARADSEILLVEVPLG
jgi:redox-sensitive bicupin YhaK (pirin superfamily)